MNHEEDIERIMEQYGNSIYRMSFFVLQNDQDAQDVLQETLIKYMQKAPGFQSDSHEKAWLLRVANNLCKDMLRFQKRNRYINLDELQETSFETLIIHGQPTAFGELTAQLFTLADKYKRTLYLHYYEGYPVKEIAQILKLSESAVKKRLERGRDKLRQMIEEDTL